MPPTFDVFDPLGESADPRRYVPLDTSERILADAAAKIRDGLSPILLTGPSGVGKTLLLRVLGERERLLGQRVAYSPFLNLPPDECARWLLHLLGMPTPAGPGAEAALLADLRSPGRLATLVLVDEIQAAPEATVRKLAELAQAGRPGLAVVVAGSRGKALEGRVPALAPEVTLPLPESLPEAEVTALCGVILASPELSPALRQSLSPRDRRKIVRAASGIPRLLKAELVFRERRLAMVPTRRPRPVEELSLDTWQRRAPAAAPPSPERAPERALCTPPIDTVTTPSLPLTAVFTTPAPPPTDIFRTPVPPPGDILTPPPPPPPPPSDIFTTPAPPLVATFTTPAPPPVDTFTTPPPADIFTPPAPPATAPLWVEAPEAPRRAPQRPGARETIGAWAAFAMHEADRTRARWAEATLRVARAAGAHRELALARGFHAAREIRSAARGALRSVASAGGRVEAALIATHRVALSAAALCLLAVFLYSGLGTGAHEIAPGSSTLAAQLATLPSPEATPLASAGTGPTPLAVQVQVNARPWAHIRIDGVDVGPTPLSRPLPPGVYRIEAEFPDGRSLQRSVEIGPEQRFVALY